MCIKEKAFFIILLFALLLSCGGESPADDITLSGTVDINDIADDIHGPLLVAITTSDDFELIEKDPLSALVDVRSVDRATCTFNWDLSESGLAEGDEVFIFGFVDNDYEDGIPDPTEGDYIGFYIDADRLSLTYRLKRGRNNNINIKVNRRIYSFDSEISGTVTGPREGDLMLIAYAGEINSMDFTQFDFDKIIGYEKLVKGTEPVQYSMQILPFGYDVPIEHVYLIALIDCNGNGLVDGGDMIGIHSERADNFPTLLTIQDGALEDKNIDPVIEIPEPSGYDISIQGSFERPDGYDENSKPIYTIIAHTDDISRIFTDPLSVITYFQRLPAGETTFDIALSGTDLLPGDAIMILALWDKDYIAGFPLPSEGDLIGYVQNKESFSYTLSLNEGVNTVPTNGYEFKINKLMYDHSASVTFQLEEGEAAGSYNPGDPVMVIAVQKEGYSLLTSEIDMDYIIGTITLDVDFSQTHTMQLFPAVYEEIAVQNPFAIDEVYFFAFLDNNPANGIPDEGEYLGFYWDRLWLVKWIYFPITYDVIDGDNVLPETIRFSQTY